MHYLEQRNQEPTPESAGNIYSRNETFRKFTANLDLTVQWYNKVRDTVLEVEFPLIESQLADIDSQLQKAEKDLNWNSEGLWEYIEATRDMVRDLEKRVQKAKDNVEQIVKIMATWSKIPLFERKEGKSEPMLNLDDRPDRLKKRYADISTNGAKVHALLKVCFHLYYKLFKSKFLRSCYHVPHPWQVTAVISIQLIWQKTTWFEGEKRPLSAKALTEEKILTIYCHGCPYCYIT